MIIDKTNQKGFQRVPWSQAIEGRNVYLEGTDNGKFYAYGPHLVIDKDRRILQAANTNNQFTHRPEELMIPMVKFTIMGSRPGDGDVVAGCNVVDALSKYFEVDYAIVEQSFVEDAERIENGHYILGDYEIKQLKE